MIRIKIKNNNQPTTLCVFDFDGTLFKSPEKPLGHQGNWWIEKTSLGPETVGQVPKDNFWNNQIVSVAKQKISDSKNYCILLTGRVDRTFQDRIEELLKQRNLNFKLVGLNTFGSDTGDFKVNKIKDILKNVPSIKNIEMWENEKDKAQLYTDTFSGHYNFKCNLVED